MAEPGSSTAPRDPRDDAAPELWSRAQRQPALEAAWLHKLAERGVPVAHTADQIDGPPAHALARGVVASIEPSAGDPQLVAVVPEGEREAFWVDRRTMRVQQWPRTSLASEDDVVAAADLADRAQLALGEPVLLRYGTHQGKLAVEAVRKLEACIEFTSASYRKLSPLVSGNGTIAPLSVDAIDRALRLERDFGDEPRVRRIFARAYRRIDEHHTPWGGPRGREALKAASSVVRLGRDVMLSLADARKFRAELTTALAKFDGDALARFDRTDLVDALRARMALVTASLALLERARLATLSLLPAIEALAGVLPRELFTTLAWPQRTPERRAIDARLVQLGSRCRTRADGTLELPPLYDPTLMRDWDALKIQLGPVRMLGMDVRPDVMGHDDKSLAAALLEAFDTERESPEGQRRKSELKVAQLSAKGPLGPLGVAPAAGVITLLHRLAQAKGALAEALAEALLRLRAVALEAGRRLAHDGVLEKPEDALYMPLDEIQEALEGELGAYAARVRLRREDDRRWRNFRPPRRLAGRRA